MNIIDKVTLNTSTSIKKAMEIIDTSEIKIALVVDISMHKELITYCQEKDTMFLSTPFDHDSIELLNNLGLEIFKIPSGEIFNTPKPLTTF